MTQEKDWRMLTISELMARVAVMQRVLDGLASYWTADPRMSSWTHHALEKFLQSLKTAEYEMCVTRGHAEMPVFAPGEKMDPTGPLCEAAEKSFRLEEVNERLQSQIVHLRGRMQELLK